METKLDAVLKPRAARLAFCSKPFLASTGAGLPGTLQFQFRAQSRTVHAAGTKATDDPRRTYIVIVSSAGRLLHFGAARRLRA